MLVIEQELVVLLFLTLLIFVDLELSLYFILVNADILFSDPSIITALQSLIVDIVTIF